MSKDEQIEKLSQLLSDSTIAMDNALEVLEEHGLGQHNESFAIEMASCLAPNEELLIKIESL